MHSTVVQCSLHHVSSHEQTVSSVLCNCAETVSFLCDIRVRAFIHFLSFFFFFFISFFLPPSLCDECVPGQIVKRNLDVCGRVFFFLVGKSTRFRFLKRINRRLNRCSRLGADERTIVWSRIGDGVLFDSFILDRAPRVIRFFFREVSERRRRIYGRDFFFFFSFRPIFENNLTAGILGYSGTVKVIFQYFGTKIELIGINNWSDLWIISQESGIAQRHRNSKSREQQHVVLCFVVSRF